MIIIIIWLLQIILKSNVLEKSILIPEKIPNDILDYKLKDIIKSQFFQYQILSLIKNGNIITMQT